MTKQEFLAFSLPYELHGIILNRVALINGIEYEKELPITWKGERFTGKCGFNIKPILHPLTDLIKEIEHNGEVFTPYIELLRLSGFNIDDMTQSELNDYKDAYSSINADPMLIPFLDGLKLIEWHFDLFNGIESGEAIDVNTLDENPYK